jgi:hypothetical protein
MSSSQIERQNNSAQADCIKGNVRVNNAESPGQFQNLAKSSVRRFPKWPSQRSRLKTGIAL